MIELEQCDICGAEETIGDTGLCTQCLDTIESDCASELEEDVELDLVEMLEKKGVY